MKWLVAWAVLATIVAVWGQVGRIVANTRADAALRAYETSAPIFAAALSESDQRIEGLQAAASASVAAAAAAEASATHQLVRADSIQRAHAALAGTVRQSLPDSLRIVFDQMRSGWAEERAAFEIAVDSLRVTIAQLRTAMTAQDAALDERAGQLARYELRLAEAVAGWEAAERARRPGLLGWTTRALALVGTVVILDRVGCALTAAERLLLPCS